MFIKKIIVGNNFTNCYLAGDRDGEGAIIDPGAEPEKIYEKVKESGMEITKIINTHGHFDHIKGNDFLKQKTGASLLIHREGQELLLDSDKNLSKLLAGKQDVVSPEADRVLMEGEKIKVGSYSLKVLYTPGHSPDSISLYCSEEGILFSGDTIFEAGIGRTDFPGCQRDVIYDSIGNKLLSLPGEVEVYPGHGGKTNIGEFKANIWERLCDS